METNIDAYSLSELLAILDLQDDVTPDAIVERTEQYIQRYRTKDAALARFFQDAQTHLLQYAAELEPPDDTAPLVDADGNPIEDEEERAAEQLDYHLERRRAEPSAYFRDQDLASYQPSEEVVNDWYRNQYLEQDDPTQVDKITDRRQKFQLFNDDHVPMNREQLATTDTFQVPVKQDTLNPNLKNTISRFINLDSQFRQFSAGAESSSTNYTLDLSDTLKNALALSLYSYQIPFSWYVIDDAYGNTTFWVQRGSQVVPIYLPPGNYSQTQFVDTLRTSIKNAGFLVAADAEPTVSYNNNNGRITLHLWGATWPGSSPIAYVDGSCNLLFYDFTGAIQLTNNSCFSKTNFYFNGTLGWVMGFRLPYEAVFEQGNTGTAILDLNGTKYLILVIDDYNQNHVNNSLVSIAQQSGIFKTPMYASPDLPYTCFTQDSNLEGLLQTLGDSQDPNVGLLVASKFEQDRTPTELLLPSAPALLTQAQLYTANEINRTRNNLTRYLSKAPTTSDILAIIPVKTSVGVPTGSLLVEFSGSLQDNKRTYFGPVNLERMAVKLLNDKGNVLNLNGNDWCCTLICECLYQY